MQSSTLISECLSLISVKLNVSMMLLGGGNAGEQCVVNHCSQATPRTVVGYLSQSLRPVPVLHFLTRPSI